jgi:hypothetical protein
MTLLVALYIGNIRKKNVKSLFPIAPVYADASLCGWETALKAPGKPKADPLNKKAG